MSSDYIGTIERAAALCPGKLAYLDESSSFNYLQFNELVDKCRASTQRLGAASGDVLVIHSAVNAQALAWIVAGMQLGFTIFPSPADEFPTGSFGDARIFSVTEKDASIVSREGPRTGPDQGSVAGNGQQPREGSIVYMTSGTTGPAKYAINRRPPRPYRGVAVMERYNAGTDFGPHVMTLPRYHFGSLGPALYALQAGSGLIIQREWNTARFASIIREFEASSAFLTADSIADMLDFDVKNGVPRFLIQHGGSATNSQVKRDLISRSHFRMLEYYGTSQGLISEVFDDEWLQFPGTVGRPYPNVAVRLRDVHQGVGSIEVERRFLAESHVEATGDFGSIEDGRIYLRDRNEGGHEVDLVAALRALEAVAGVYRGATTEEDIFWVESFSPSASQAAMMQSKDIPADAYRAVRIVAFRSLPRSLNGKVLRSSLGVQQAQQC